LVGIATPVTPSSAARETPTAAPRALNVPVGIRPSFAEGHDPVGIGDREQFVVAPQAGRAGGEVLRGDRGGDLGQVIPR
jgi:hypothetical protein